MDKIPLTRAGHTALNEELKTLKSVERPAVIRAIAEAREHGDLSENAEYHAARSISSSPVTSPLSIAACSVAAEGSAVVASIESSLVVV